MIVLSVRENCPESQKCSLVAQTVKNLPAMRENWIQSLGWEDPLEEGMATHSSILAWRITMDREAWRATVLGGHKESDTTEWLSTAQHIEGWPLILWFTFAFKDPKFPFLLLLFCFVFPCQRVVIPFIFKKFSWGYVFGRQYF